jgi:hypothetical protein
VGSSKKNRQRTRLKIFKMKRILLLVFIFSLGFLAGDFESREIKKKIESIKIKYFSKKNLEIDKNNVSAKKIKIKGNSYEVLVEEFLSLELSSDDQPEYVLRTAGFQIDKSIDKYKYKLFFQNGIFVDENKIHKINLPKTTIYAYSRDEKNIFYGGLKSVFSFNKKDFGIISKSKSGCDYLSIIELNNNKVLLDGNCLPAGEDPDFNGSGGAYFFDNENLYIAIGTPTSDSPKTSMLAQDEKSIYGKILKISKTELLKNDNEKIQFSIFSMGHRNPQGLIKLKDKIYSTEHGPQGGDEINLIVEKGNYEWPLKSYGTRYEDGKSYKYNKYDKNFVDPLYAFVPSIAPSSLAKCPKNLQNFYDNNICLMSLSLREQSLFVILLNQKNNRVQNIEKINFGKRMRHFGSNLNGEIFFDNDAFFISTDDLKILKIKFLNFR